MLTINRDYVRSVQIDDDDIILICVGVTKYIISSIGYYSDKRYYSIDRWTAKDAEYGIHDIGYLTKQGEWSEYYSNHGEWLGLDHTLEVLNNVVPGILVSSEG